jgi:UrcA family protein
MKLKLALVALSLGSVITAPAFANTNLTERSETVQTSDLNLETFAGRKRLEMRIASTARRVCGVGEDRTLRASAAARTCYKKAIDDVQSQVTAALRMQNPSVALMESSGR